MTHRAVADLTRDLRTYCESHDISVSELAKKTSIPQSTVHRILHSPRSNRVTPHMKTLCDYANIPVFMTNRPDPAQSGVMMSALREVWDGTEASATAIAKMLLAARDVCLSAGK